MKKKKIYIGLTIASLLMLSSCGNVENIDSSNVIESSDSPSSTTTKRDRGSEESYSDVHIPDVFTENEYADYLVKYSLENENGGYDTVLTINQNGIIGELTQAEEKEFEGYYLANLKQETIKEDGSTVVELKYRANVYNLKINAESGGIVAGEGEYYAYDDMAYVTAKPYIGYDFLGWYDGDDLLSEDKSYSFKINEDINLIAKFEISDDFIHYGFESNNSECIIKEFYNDIDDVIIPEGVTEIDNNAFRESQIKTLILPKSLNRIDQYAFYKCYSLNQVTLNSNLEIAYAAFEDCYNLVEVYNNSDLNLSEYNNHELGYYAYKIHSNLDEESIIINKDGYVFAHDTTSWYLIGSYVENNLELPESFNYKNEVINNYVIKQRAFYQNKNINSIKIPSSVTRIDNYAFYGCKYLYEVFNESSLQIELNSTSNGYVAKYALKLHYNINDDNNVIVDGDFIYLLEDHDGTPYARIIQYRGNDKNIIINGYKNYPTIIDDNLFSGTDIESLITTEGVVEIDEFAFMGCKYLKRIELMDVKNIRSSAFSGCVRLVDVSLEQVINIEDYAFDECYSLYQIEFPVTLIELGDTFNGCHKLYEIINKSSLDLGDYDFDNVKNISNIDNNYESKIHEEKGIVYYADSDIGERIALAILDDVEELTLGFPYTKVEEYAFAFSNIKILRIHENVSTIGDNALYETEINKLELHSVYNGIGRFFGSNYSDQNDMYVPKTLTEIIINSDDEIDLSDAFYKFKGLVNVRLPKKFICDYNTFYGCNSLKNIYYEGIVDDWFDLGLDSNNNPMFIANNLYFWLNNGEYNVFVKDVNIDIHELDIIPEAYLTGISINELTLSDNLNSIGNYAFYKTKIKSINLPGKLTSIGNSAFAKSTLTSITIPEGCTIGDSAFDSCKSLVLANINTNSIGLAAFNSCYNLQIVNFNENLDTIGYGAFENCISLRDALLENTKITELNDNVFANCTNLGTVTLPSTLVDIADTAFNNSNNIKFNTYDNGYYLGIGDNPYYAFIKAKNTNIKSLEINDNCKMILNSSLTECNSLKSIVIPNSITKLGNILCDCYNIEEITLPFIGDGESYKCFDNLFLPNSTYATVSIPKYLKKVVITGNIDVISKNAFKKFESIEEIVLPESITKIEESAFENCGVKNINIPSNLTTIETSAFYESGIISIDLSNSNVNSIGSYAFSCCNDLESVKLPSNLEEISSGLFYQSTKIDNIIIPDTVTTINYEAFSYCRSLSKIDLSNLNITALPTLLFNGCWSLVEVKLPTNLESIGDSVFYNCSSLSKIDVPATVTSIGQYAFRYSGLSEFTYKANFNNVSSNAFECCEKLINLKIEEGVTTIPQYCFGSSGLLSLTLPSTLTSIGNYAFSDCNKLVEIYNLSNLELTIGEEDNGCVAKYAKVIHTDITEDSIVYIYNDYLFSYDGTSLSLLGYLGNDTEISLPEKVIINNQEISNYDISSYAFYQSTFEKIYIPNSVTAIEEYAFYDSAVIEVEIAEGLTEIGHYAIGGCNELKTVKLPSTIKNLASYAFAYNKNLENIIFTECNLIEIGEYAFYGSNSFKSFDFGNKLTNIGKYAFYSTGIEEANLPSSLLNVDTYAFQKSKLKTVTINNKNTVFGTYVFSECESLKTVVFNNEMTSINAYLFYKCTNLENITLPNKLEEIGNYAFNGCTSLTEITIPKSVKIIGKYVFGDCKYINKLEFEEGSSLEEIGDYAFYNCRALTNLNVNFENVSVGKYLFNNCVALQEVTYKNIIVGEYMFNGCTNLTKVTLDDNTRIIKERAFSGCNRLLLIENYDNVELIGNYAFYSTSIGSFNLGKNITTLGENVFDTCKNLSIVTFDEEFSLTTIPANTFRKCNALANITLPSTITKFGNYAFAESALESIVIPASLTNIGMYAFQMCSKLASVTFEEGCKLTVIGDNTFESCSSLTTIEFPSTISTIKYRAFYAAGLKSLHLSSQITSLGIQAFSNCQSLENLIIDGRTTTPNLIFGYCKSLKYVSIVNMTYLGSSNFYYSNIDKLIISNKLSEIHSGAFTNGKIDAIYYVGEPTEFETLSSSTTSTVFKNASVYYYSETEPTDTNYNYWYYDNDNNVVIWGKE